MIAHMNELLQYLDGSMALPGVLIGVALWFVLRHLIFGFFTVDQNERAVLTTFGRAQRVLGATTTYTEVGAPMRDSEKERYDYPQLRVIPPGGPYFKWPWQRVHKVSIATQTINMARDLEDAQANHQGRMLEAVTKDQLNTGLMGEIRFRVSESNLYPYLFGVKNPIVHVMGFFVSILRERIANFEAPGAGGDPARALPAPGAADPTTALAVAEGGGVSGVSINDLRKNLRSLNETMDEECRASTGRYGITLDASLITSIDPPHEVESALAAINTAHNHVSSEISLAQAAADQKIVQSHRAVEIETLRAKTEVEPLHAQAEQLAALKASGPEALRSYVRNVRLSLYSKADRVFMEVK
jgi:regulator of protease activity HflC (stomatin/prohibitin superfamily)